MKKLLNVFKWIGDTVLMLSVGLLIVLFAMLFVPVLELMLRYFHVL